MKKRLEHIESLIRKAALARGGGPDSVRLVAVSKTMPVEKIREAIGAGATVFGENYIQEARRKFDELSANDISWHFIGHLQSNKAKYAVRLFDLIHSVDSYKLTLELDRQAKKRNKVQQVLIQVNISGEASKSGAPVDGTENLIRQISLLENVSVRGLMTMPPFFNEPEKARPFFSALRKLRDGIRGRDIPNVALEELSMGMTGDFEVAIEEGATLVRIGTALFGSRTVHGR